jgi:hypothetical protein
VLPVKLDPAVRRDKVSIRIPGGFQLDELPAAARVESAYGKLQAAWTLMDGEIIFEQTVEINDTVAPAADFDKIRDFFDKVGAALAAPVILIRP